MCCAGRRGARSRRCDHAGTGGGLRLQPPGGPADLGHPQYDNTDVYAFVSPDKPDTTTIVANWIPFEEPGGGPNFYTFAEDAQYDLHIDNNGDAQGDLLLPLHLQDARQEQEHVPVQHGRGRRASTTPT